MAGLEGSAVLVVEDEFVIAIDLQLTLYRLGCEVLGPVASVAEALVLLRHERPDAAVLDVCLADGRVVPLAEALRAAAVPFLLATVCDPAELPEPALAAAPRLAKPCEEGALRSALAGLLAGGR